MLVTDDIHILRGVGVGVHAVASRCSSVWALSVVDIYRPTNFHDVRIKFDCPLKVVHQIADQYIKRT